MQQQLLLGNEALGLGALDAGLSGVFGYPGTPSTEIFEFVEKLAKKYGVRAVWSTNEKVALEEALGMSFAGKRTLITMKHVGLNVAADPFMNAAMTGVGGGLAVAVADDPSMHSSQNEQDSRYYADFARIPCFEPSNQQEAYDIMRHAFDVSETMDVPVLIRMLTRLSHSRANITPSGDRRSQNPLKASDDMKKWVLLPVNARVKNLKLIEKQAKFVEMAERSPYNKLTLHDKASRGIIACGIAWNYVQENLVHLEQPVHLLKISQYPIPKALVRRLVDASDEILVVEDGYPFVESKLKGLFGIPGKVVRGRTSGDLPPAGEMNADHVRKALGLPAAEHASIGVESFPARPPMLCVGCPHADTFKALAEAARDFEGIKMFSDIGCYTLGVLPPYHCGDTCVDMGASVSMAFGASSAGVRPVVAIIGDSTFAHSGMTPLLGAAKENADMTVFIMDNALVAMTGAQKTMTTGDHLVKLVTALGVDAEHVVTLTPLPKYHEENVLKIKAELSYHGTSVIIPQRPCLYAPKPQKKG